MVTRCYFCGGRTTPARVTAENWWGDRLALVENVPAWVCTECGEKYFEASIVERLDALRTSPPRGERTVEVPVYSFSPAA